jgi:hypothetical protein
MYNLPEAARARAAVKREKRILKFECLFELKWMDWIVNYASYLYFFRYNTIKLNRTLCNNTNRHNERVIVFVKKRQCSLIHMHLTHLFLSKIATIWCTQSYIETLPLYKTMCTWTLCKLNMMYFVHLEESILKSALQRTSRRVLNQYLIISFKYWIPEYQNYW